MISYRVKIIVVAMLLWLSVSLAHGQEVSDLDRFKLWNDCKPISLIVENLPEDALNIGLSADVIETTVRSRLRSARIYKVETGAPYLYVRINMVRNAYSTAVQLNKPVLDIASGRIVRTSTWNTGSVGMHGQNSNYILSIISQYTDEFIDEYLRVNESACK